MAGCILLLGCDFNHLVCFICEFSNKICCNQRWASKMYVFLDNVLLQWSSIRSKMLSRRARLSQSRNGSIETPRWFAINTMARHFDQCSSHRIHLCSGYFYLDIFQHFLERHWTFLLQIGQDWTAYVMMSDLPKYMKEVLGFPVKEVGLYSSLPYLLMWFVSVSSAFLCDHMIDKGYVTITQARKIFTTAGMHHSVW